MFAGIFRGDPFPFTLDDLERVLGDVVDNFSLAAITKLALLSAWWWRRRMKNQKSPKADRRTTATGTTMAGIKVFMFELEDL